jgi:hypothetical protein
MMKNYLGFAVLALAPFVLAPDAHAAPTSFCASNFSSCNIFEDGQVLTLPGLGISGDVVLMDRFTGTVSDVFRIFNDFFNSGGGTGLGQTAFLYSEDLHNLPAPATYSANVTFINEAFGRGGGAVIETDYNGNGTIYKIFSIDDAVLLWRSRRKPALRG